MGRLTLCSGILVASLIARTAGADPILITSGTASVTWDLSTATFTLAGDNFAATAGGIGGAAAHFGADAGGATTDLNGLIFPGPNFTGTLTLNGVTYHLPGNARVDDSGLFWDGTLTFDTVPFVLPTTTDPGFVATTPFTMTGTLRGFQGAPPHAGQSPVFSVDVFGAGTASAPLRNVVSGGRNFFLNQVGVSYVFRQSPPAPTPEPATIILFGTAVAGLAAWRHRRRQ